jgi:hypothetical protein
MRSELLERAEKMTWKEYVKSLDLSHWGWENSHPADDRWVFYKNEGLIVYPIYAVDIMNDVGVSYEFLDDGLAISWDNFQEDCTVLIDIPEEPLGYLLVEKVNNCHWELAVDRVFTEISEIKEFLEDEQKG